MHPQSTHTHTKIHLANEAINIIYQLTRFCGQYHDVKITRWSPSGPAMLAIHLRPTSRNSRHAVSTRARFFAIRLSTLLPLQPLTMPRGIRRLVPLRIDRGRSHLHRLRGNNANMNVNAKMCWNYIIVTSRNVYLYSNILQKYIGYDYIITTQLQQLSSLWKCITRF